MTSATYSRVPPPAPPADGLEYDGTHPTVGDLMTVPLARANITLLQALTQPSKLRRRVAPNFEIVSWDDPDHMQYSLSGYRPAQPDDTTLSNTRGNVRLDAGHRPNPDSLPRTEEKGGYDGKRYDNDNDDRARSGGGGRSTAAAGTYNVDTGRQHKFQEYVVPPSSQPGSGSAARRGAPPGAWEAVSDDCYCDDDRRRGGQGRHPERPPPPLPSSRLRQQQHEPSGTGDYYSDGHNSVYDEDASELDYPIGCKASRSGEAPGKTGRLNTRAFEDRCNRAEERPSQQGVHDVNYDEYDVDSSRPTRFQEVINMPDEYDSACGCNTDNARNTRNENVNDNGDRGDYRCTDNGGYDSHRSRRPLRDNWEKPHFDNDNERARHGKNSNNDNSLPGDRHGRHPNVEYVYEGEDSNNDNTSYDDEDELSGEVISCDNEVMAVPSSCHRPLPRPPMLPPPAPHTTRRTAQPKPPVLPERGQTYSKKPLVYATREETTVQRKKSVKHNPKAFKNKTTHSWISTNTTTTVILPAATVQLVPLSGFTPVVEEVSSEERWASQPYMLNVPHGAGYQHLPSQMTVLDVSEDVTANETRGCVGNSLPQLPRRAYDSANNTNLHSGMSEL